MIPALLLVVSAILYRIVTGLWVQSGALANFAPLAAIALCSAAYFPARYKFTVPLFALLVSDIVLNLAFSESLFAPAMLVRYFALALVGGLGLLLQNRPSLKTLLPASLAGSFLFYFITNAVAWLTDPGYVKNLGGFFQALTVGLPGYAPTWMFLRNSLVSDLFFTFLFVVCMHLGRSTEKSRAAVAQPRPA